MYVAELLLCLPLQLLEVKGQLITQNGKPPQSSFPCVLLTHRTLIPREDREVTEALKHTNILSTYATLVSRPFANMTWRYISVHFSIAAMNSLEELQWYA